MQRLTTMVGDEKATVDVFYTEMLFGTAWARGIIGAGTNYMNIYPVEKVTKGMAERLYPGLITVKVSTSCRSVCLYI